jgi:hypothetical protein
VRTDGAVNRRSQVAVSTDREIGGHGSGSSHAVGSTPTRPALEAPVAPVRPSPATASRRLGGLAKQSARNAALRRAPRLSVSVLRRRTNRRAPTLARRSSKCPRAASRV